MTMAKGGGAAIKLDGVRFAYGDWEVRYDLSVGAGDIVALMGPSGSGKSTLLDLVAGFRLPTAGRILIGETDVTHLPPSQRPISMIFQENNLFGHLDVAANVGLGRSPSLRLTAADREDIACALEETGLGGKGARLPAELSGGERQRVALARTLVRDQPVFLLDEAFASLGPALRNDMLGLVDDLQAARGMTVLMVTHQPDDARFLGATLALLVDGRVAATGPVEEMLGPDAPDAMRAYLGSDIKSRVRARKGT